MKTRVARLLAVASSALLASALVGAPAAATAGEYRSTASSYYTSVACPTAEVCVAVGAKEVDRQTASGVIVGGSFVAMAARSVDGGKTWSPLAVPATNADLHGVSCWSAGQCVAVGSTEAVARGSWYPVHAVVLLFAGSSVGRVTALPASALALSAVSCPTQATCVAVGGSNVPGTITLRPQVLVSHDQAASWAQAPLPLATGELQGVSCSGPLRCVTVGVVAYTANGASTSRPVALASSTGGRSWKTAAIPSAGAPRGMTSGGPDAVSCTSTTRCTAVGDNFDWCQCGTGVPGRYGETWTTPNGGRTWEVHSLPTVESYDIWYANAVSCWGASTCAMAGSGTTTKPGSLYYALVVPLSAATGGVAGTAMSSASGLRPQYINGLACQDTTHCVAVGQNWSRPSSATIETRSAVGWATTYTAG